MMFEWDERLILRLLLLVSFNSDKEHIPPQACTPKPLGGDSVSLKKHQTARKIASLLRNPSALRPKGSHQKSVLMIRETSVKKNIAAAAATTNLIQDNQAIKRQKLDDGRSRHVSPLFSPLSSANLNSISQTLYSSDHWFVLDSQSKTNDSAS